MGGHPWIVSGGNGGILGCALRKRDWGRMDSCPRGEPSPREWIRHGGRRIWYSGGMEKNRLEAFSDGVLAIIITIMVLGMKVPQGTELGALKPVLPVFLCYVLSFLYLGIYWNNHHHLLKAIRRVNGRIMWANLHLLFWLSLFPFVTGWMGENHFAPVPTACYGAVLLLAAIAYIILQRIIIADYGCDSKLAAAFGRDFKGKLSPVFYAVAIPAAFLSPWISNSVFVFVALLWLVPDRRIARALEQHEG